MLWMEYNIRQFGSDFTIEGNWPGEVMGKNQDGRDKNHYLYKPGDVFVVQPNGILKKVDKLSEMILKHDDSGSNK